MLKRLLWFLLVGFVAEIAVLVWIASETSGLFTVGLVLLTTLMGGILARWQGTIVLRKAQVELASGKMPAERVFEGLLVFLAGVLLIIPGVLTDLMGISLLIPPVRRLIRRRLTARLKRHTSFHAFGPSWTATETTAGAGDDVIDAESVRPIAPAKLEDR